MTREQWSILIDLCIKERERLTSDPKPVYSSTYEKVNQLSELITLLFWEYEAAPLELGGSDEDQNMDE